MSDLPDTIYSKAAFTASLPAGFDGVFHWEWISEAVQKATKRNIKPMDIDAHIEVGGQHLIFETKEAGVEIPWGQKKALLQFWAKGYTTVVFLWGKKFPLEAEIFYPGGRRVLLKGATGARQTWVADQLVEFVYNWSKWADGKGRCPFNYNGGDNEPIEAG